MAEPLRPQVRPLRLREALRDVTHVATEPDTTITGVTLDSRAVQSGDLYLALPGRNTHGARYADEAVASGAAAIVTDAEGAVLCSGVTCSFSSGELVAVVGPNGAGKSSLLALLAGDVEPASGSVNLDGRSMRDFAPVDLARQRAVLTQTNVVAFPFSVREVVSMGRFAWKSRESAVDDTAVVNAAMEATDIAHLAQRRGHPGRVGRPWSADCQLHP